MLSSMIRSAGVHRQFRKSSNISYSVWRSVRRGELQQTSADRQKDGDIHRVFINFHCGPQVDVCRVQARFLSTTTFRTKEPSSKVEETVERLKGKIVEKPVNSPSTEVAKAAEPKKSLWVRVKDEVMHYYSGFKLLYLDVKVSSKIVWKILRGKTLTRRESRQLVRTTSDLFRLVPFSIFIIVPFMELLLPVALKLFPGMLPSTFTTRSQREDKLKKAVVAKLEYTRFLQKTLDEMGPKGSGRSSQSARDFVQFYHELKKTNEDRAKLLDNDKIMKFAQAFEDHITLDNMDRNQLSAICRLLNLTPIGTSTFLRLQIDMRLRHLKSDDRLINKEGMDRMSHAELQTANQERGMPAFGLSESRLKAQLGEWIDLSLNYKVPPSLLLLSRTLYNIDEQAPTQKVASAISALSEKAATATSATIGEREGKIRNVERLQQIKEEQRKIEEEAKEKERLEKIKQQQQQKAVDDQVAVEAKKLVKESTSPITRATVTDVGEVTPADEILVDKAPVLVDKAPIMMDKAPDSGKAEVLEESKASNKVVDASPVSTSNLSDLKSAIESLGMSQTEKETLKEIKKELKDYDEDLRELDEIKSTVERLDLHESRAAKLLFSRVNSMLKKADSIVNTLQEKKSLIHQEIEAAGEDNAEQSEKIVTIQELIEAVTKLQKTPNQAKVDQIAQVLSMMDADADGVIKVDHVLKVIELLGMENTELPAKQIKQIIKVLCEEEKQEVEDSIEDILVKQPSKANQSAEVDEAFEKDLRDLEDLASKEEIDSKTANIKKESRNGEKH